VIHTERMSLNEGIPLPVLDGLDVNSDENRRLIADLRRGEPRDPGQFFVSETEFEETLSRLDQA
jgi:hypothetical protein